jgi:hypothetical protein
MRTASVTPDAVDSRSVPAGVLFLVSGGLVVAVSSGVLGGGRAIVRAGSGAAGEEYPISHFAADKTQPQNIGPDDADELD